MQTTPAYGQSGNDPNLVIERIIKTGMTGCTGGNMSPALQWTGAPAGTKSFVVTLFDPDVPETGSGWWHWVVYDLLANANSLSKGAGAEHSSTLLAGTQQGRTDLGNDAYHGACSDKGQPPHHYRFTIYALSVEKLDVPPEASGAMVTATAKENVLGKAVFIALRALNQT